MKKTLVNLIVQFNIKQQNINLLICEGENLTKADLFTIKIEGNVFCESVFSKNLRTALKKVNLNNNCKYNLKVILPDEFFKEEIIKLKNTFINNFFAEKQLNNYVENAINYSINYKKTKATKNCVFYKICYIKKWVLKSLKNINKVYKFKLDCVVSESAVECSFINSNYKFLDNSFIVAKFLENNVEIKLIENEHCEKKVVLKNIENKENFTRFSELCKSLALYEYFENKKHSLNNYKLNGSLENVIKYINLLNNNKDYKIIVVYNEQNKEILNSLKKLDKSNDYLSYEDILKCYAKINNYELLGALYYKNFNNLNLFNFSFLKKTKCKIFNLLNNIKVYFKYLNNKVNVKNKTIKLKLD